MKDLLTIHATMTPPNFNWRKRDIDRRDRAHGLSQIGYHYVIERDGTLVEGRPDNLPSMHEQTPDEVMTALSVVLVGGVDESGEASESSFTAEQRITLARIINMRSEAGPGASVVSRTPALNL